MHLRWVSIDPKVWWMAPYPNFNNIELILSESKFKSKLLINGKIRD